MVPAYVYRSLQQPPTKMLSPAVPILSQPSSIMQPQNSQSKALARQQLAASEKDGVLPLFPYLDGLDWEVHAHQNNVMGKGDLMLTDSLGAYLVVQTQVG